MIEGLKNLHDARYCAAVGISMVSFDLDAGSEAALTPTVVKEIVEWLSGLESIGRFGYDSGESIAEKAAAALVGRVMLPVGCDLEEADKVDLPKIFDASQETLTANLLQRLQTISGRFPESLFLLAALPDGAVSAQWAADLKPFMARSILRYDSPDAIYHQLNLQGLQQPYGFSLGNFATDESGLLDYDACDSFLDRFETLVPA